MEHVHDCRFDSTAQAGLKIHGQQIAGPGHVGADLGHQGIGGVETLLVAQTGHEVQAQLAAVAVVSVGRVGMGMQVCQHHVSSGGHLMPERGRTQGGNVRVRYQPSNYFAM